MKLELEILEVFFLKEVLEKLSRIITTPIFELEKAVLEELYERKIKLFHFPAKTRFKIKNSEYIALKKFLLLIPIHKNNDIQIYRNSILDKLNRLKK